MGREREYADNAARQRAYRARKAAEQEAREKGRSSSSTGSHRPSGSSSGGNQRVLVSRKLVKILGMLGSDHAGERDNAARAATRILKEAGLTWFDVLGVKDD